MNLFIQQGAEGERGDAGEPGKPGPKGLQGPTVGVHKKQTRFLKLISKLKVIIKYHTSKEKMGVFRLY